MKIKYAIVGSNENPTYLDFWPIVEQLWVELIKIKPILVLISDKDLVTDNGRSIIHEIKKIDGIDTGFQSQIARMYVTKFYPDDICLTSDIDMLPLSTNYFNNILNSVDDEYLAILSADAYKAQRYPICYNAAKGATFNELLSLHLPFDQYVNKLKGYNWGWDTDELYFGMCIQDFPKERIKKIKRGWIGGVANNRIDRINWGYDEIELINDGYIDCHSLRPYNQHKESIDELIKSRLC